MIPQEVVTETDTVDPPPPLTVLGVDLDPPVLSKTGGVVVETFEMGVEEKFAPTCVGVCLCTDEEGTDEALAPGVVWAEATEELVIARVTIAAITDARSTPTADRKLLAPSFGSGIRGNLPAMFLPGA